MKNTQVATITPETKSINTCCFTNRVETIIEIDIININNLKYLFDLLLEHTYSIHNILIAQCCDGKQFNTGVSIQNINLVRRDNKSFPTTVGLLTVVGYDIGTINNKKYHDIYGIIK